MALADLRALARAYGRGTRDLLAMGPGTDAVQNEEIHGVDGAGTHGTCRTREIGDAGEYERLMVTAALPLPSLEAAADEVADRAAIAAEPPLLAPGTFERDRLDHRQRESVAGLLMGWERHRTMT
jgi:hypothetical protein